jgi:hypothetical protein
LAGELPGSPPFSCPLHDFVENPLTPITVRRILALIERREPMSHPVGTVVIIKDGKAEQRWQITSPLKADQYHASGFYGARRWIKKNAKWSSNDYMLSPNQITRVE